MSVFLEMQHDAVVIFTYGMCGEGAEICYNSFVCLIYGVSDVFRLKMGHPANQQHLLQFVGLLKGSDFGKAHFPRDLMQASHFQRTASTSSVEVLTTNAAKVGTF